MSLKKHGKNISGIEILGISKWGLWILVRDKEYYLEFKKFPWFAKAPLEKIMKAECLHGMHLYWPDLDIDLELASLEHPERYPLLAR